MLKQNTQNKKAKFVRGNQSWTDEIERLVKQLIVNGVIDPTDIRKKSVAWLFTDPAYPLPQAFDISDQDKWRVFQRHLKRLSTVYISEKEAGGLRVSPASE